VRVEKILNKTNKRKQSKQHVIAAFEQLIIQVNSIEQMLQKQLK